MDVLSELQPWHWLILAFLLLAAEALGAGGFLLGAVCASLLVALALWLVDGFSWTAQMLIFAAGSLFFTVVYWFLFKRANNKNDYPVLNNRAAQLIGRVFELEQDITAGQGRAQIGDTLWKVQSRTTLTKGTRVAVVSCQGLVLVIEEVRLGQV